ncbi:SGNH/GDSL hydrolase family protein [Sunxiuqinia indica]|uniref:SGNH/GDSL hydrolase family protein n=1 Tax=Sunxiuqinia indica TaxID=2692584 RepID=UPI0013576970|nr:SGNH/GDSL hydrolase family protein [Sunxiuqinia indica]
MIKKLLLLFCVGFTFCTKPSKEADLPDKFDNVFVLGNSITLGFGTHGMASSDINTDYYYWVHQYLYLKDNELVMERHSGKPWEAGNDGALDGLSEVRLAYLENTVAENIDGTEDLVIIQLGDNVNTDDKKKHFKEDAVVLINWFRTKCPDAKILWVYGWYNLTSNMPLLKEAILEAGGCELVDISGYSSYAKYKSETGNKYVDRNGNIQKITSTGVASHPGDLGMEMIAKSILEVLE